MWCFSGWGELRELLVAEVIAVGGPPGDIGDRPKHFHCSALSTILRTNDLSLTSPEKKLWLLFPDIQSKLFLKGRLGQ